MRKKNRGILRTLRQGSGIPIYMCVVCDRPLDLNSWLRKKSEKYWTYTDVKF